jgi:hypothetical protein
MWTWLRRGSIHPPLTPAAYLAGRGRRSAWRGGGEMLLADSSYPLLNIFWTIFIFFLWGDLDLDPDLGVHRHLPQS